ncbi:MAG: hypothetical protein EA361_03050 [Bacteroidetes bacterium]|nr:MAG: hypothetical protein EA361_03050 [Bacteroidota bacterium]
MAYIIDDHGNIVRPAPITGIAPSSGGKSGAKRAYGSFKSVSKWISQFLKRGWTPQKVTEAITKGKSFNAVNMVNKGNGATRYVHPTSGQSVVIDNVTREILHVGGHFP